ncbi:Uncharacterized membrane protein, DUF485 family [Lentibacillus persicus]|uniref:Uncharacterized membrane protein, DUF485 family n=1 Tax=Lentibacillus persicus TaxID=640948 RepID=A0A1I1UD28_9BACI|nr:DUF485 domain-containing protein [Lentibacillus persicus]SFD68594.1 Uncharacterized membrane protein, DUF485 family [Lentibacillus persicus]
MSTLNEFKTDSQANDTVDFEKIEQSEQFNSFIENKKKFVIPYTIFFLIFYFLLPVLTSYTTFLNTPIIGPISWVWIFAFAQFVMTWVLCTIYVRKAAKFDEQADQILKDQIDNGDGGRAS